MKPIKKGFTLIELVMVIVILGILASMALPKFVDFKYKSIVRSEQRIMLEVLGAVTVDYMKNVAQGSEVYYQGCPLSLLTQWPQGWTYNAGWWGGDVCYMMCPHCTSNDPDNPGPGAVFGYRRSNTTPGYYPILQPGRIGVLRDGHGGTIHYWDFGKLLSDWAP